MPLSLWNFPYLPRHGLCFQPLAYKTTALVCPTLLPSGMPLDPSPRTSWDGGRGGSYQGQPPLSARGSVSFQDSGTNLMSRMELQAGPGSGGAPDQAAVLRGLAKLGRSYGTAV